MPRTAIKASSIVTADGRLGDTLVVADGKVAAIGDGLTAHHTVEFDGFVTPGLRDAHFHPATYTASLVQPALKTAIDFAEVGERLHAASTSLDPGVPIVGLRLDDETLAEGRLPTRVDLDTLAPDRPVLLHRYCGHIAIANTAALELAAIGPDTEDPVGGSLDREDGAPNGILRETAVTLVAAAMARQRGSSITPDQIAAAMRGLASLGLTSIGAIVGCGDSTWADLGDETALLADAAADIPIRLNVFVIAQDIAQLEGAAERVSGGNVRFIGLKAFGDGSLGGHTAAMHEPFSDVDTVGTLRLDHEWAVGLARQALPMSERIAIHAIGDRANAAVLDVFDQLIADGADPAQLRVEHASVLGREEIARFAHSGVTASVQPAFMASETAWLEDRVGPDRLPLTYPLRTLTDVGVPLAGGSDCPVEPPHPLWGMAAARDRCGLVPEEALTASEALALFTSGAAAAIAEPAPLAEGSPADFVVLDRDPLRATPDELRATKVLATYVDGNLVDVSGVGEVWQG
ncbi:MAG: amidohydrolase [Acidimicrobiia bacterium]|nr:amidohydrolase [Acidimicrobiia bacterium]